MITAFFITIIPTLLAYFILPKVGIHVKSKYLKLTFAWFIGLYTFTFITYFLSIIYVLFTHDVLSKAIYTTLLLAELLFFVFYKDLLKLLLKAKNHVVKNKLSLLTHIFIVGFCLLFSYAFLAPHLSTHDGNIYRSVIYWDFHWHVGVIQSFAFGDNFPPQNESYAGAPMSYHFFGDLVMAMYEVGGLTLTDAVTYSSILFLFFALIGIIGFCEEVFHAKWIGFIAVLMTITTSSLHFLYYFSLNDGVPLWKQISMMLTNNNHPWYMSFIHGSPFHYNGVMFNLFYFLEERHMFLAPVFILLSAWIIYKRHTLSNLTLLIAGLAMGAFFYWHAFITIMILVSLFFVLVFDGERKKTMILFASCFVLFLLQYSSLASIMQTSPHYLAGATKYPQINITLAVSSAQHTLQNITKDLFTYYGFAYGLKFVLAPIGLFLIWRKNKPLGVVLAALTIPIFIIINTLQFSPTGVGENHKFLLNMNIILNIATAYVIYLLLIKKQINTFLGVLCLLLVTLSGFIEHMPFIHSKPTTLYARYSSTSLAAVIRQNTEPKATILGNHVVEIHLAGRKLFVGASAGPSESLNKPMRSSIVANIYNADTIQAFCKIATINNIDFIEFSKKSPSRLKNHITQLQHFEGVDNDNNLVQFVDINKSCR